MFSWLKWRFYEFRLFIKSKFQKLIYGFEFRDAWDLSESCAKFMVPRLKYFRDNIQGVPIKKGGEMHDDGPDTYTIEEWRAMVEEMIFAFEFVLKRDDYLEACWPPNHEFKINIGKDGLMKFNDDVKPNYASYDLAYARHRAGLKTFCEFYNDLWN